MTISMSGQLVADEWAWLYEFFEIPHCCPQQVREAIEGLGPDEDLVIEINCPGGDVWAGFEIFGMLQACRAHTEAHITAMAASAATTVTSACDTVLASPVAQLMIHQPSAAVMDYLDNDGAKELLNFLDSVKASIINGYVLKAGGKTPRSTFERLVDDSTWMPVQDAIELGLVDGILDADEEAAARIREMGGVLVTNMAMLQPGGPADLLRRYEDAVRNGAKAAPGHPVETAGEPEAVNLAEDPEPVSEPEPEPEEEARDEAWRMRARLALEKERAGK